MSPLRSNQTGYHRAANVDKSGACAFRDGIPVTLRIWQVQTYRGGPGLYTTLFRVTARA